MLPKIHPRHDVCEKARMALLGFTDVMRKRFTLTPSEEMALLAEAQSRLALMCVRSERREKCKTCGGSGGLGEAPQRPCQTCNGDGTVAYG